MRCPVIKRNAMKEEDTLVPYTMEEVEVMLDETEINSYDDMDKEFYTPEEVYELIMRDIRAIYEMKDAV